MEGLQLRYLLNDFRRQRFGLHRIWKRAADLWPVTRRRLLRLLSAEPLVEDLLLRGSEIELARRRGRARPRAKRISGPKKLIRQAKKPFSTHYRHKADLRSIVGDVGLSVESGLAL
jgi:hypothetical protein